MTRAAAILNVAQPALGQQIRYLEDELKTPLFERHSRGVHVTAAGQLLYEHARDILGRLDAAQREVMALGKDRRETIRLGLTPSIVSMVGAELLSAARRDLPDVFLSLVEGPSFTLETALARGDIDVALTYDIPEQPGIERKAMLREEILLVGRPGTLPPAAVVPLTEVLAMELILAHDRDVIRRIVEAAARTAGVPVQIAYEVQSLVASQQATREGLAASLLPYGVIARELEGGQVETRRIEPPLMRQLYLARQAGKGPFTNEAGLMKLLRSVVRQLVLDLGDLAAPVEE